MNGPSSARIGFGPRLAAFVIDSFIVALLSSLVMSQLMGDVFQNFISGRLTEALLNGGLMTGSPPGDAAAQIQRVSTFIAYFSALYMMIEAFLGATPGKMLLGLKVGDDQGRAGDIWLYFPRYLLKNGSVLLDLVGRTIGFAFIQSLGGLLGMVIFFGCFLVLGPRRQAVHDLLARTAVYRRDGLA